MDRDKKMTESEHNQLPIRERQQLMTDALHWTRVGERLVELGLVSGGMQTTSKSEELLKESAALGIFPDTSEESCRSFLRAATKADGLDLERLVMLWMNVDHLEEDIK